MPFELNYGYMPMFIGGITSIDNTKPGDKQFVNLAINNLEKAHNAIIESCVTQTRQCINIDRKNSPSLLVIRCTYPPKTLHCPRPD
jgi:hypothetical protein